MKLKSHNKWRNNLIKNIIFTELNENLIPIKNNL